MVKTEGQVWTLIVWAMIFALASFGIFILCVSLENFGSLLSASIGENGFLSIHKFLFNNWVALAFCLTAFSTAFALILVAFSRTRLGGSATKIIVGITSISVSTLVSWIGRTSEFSNGQLFRSATEGYADPIRMFVFVASTSATFTFFFIFLLLALLALFDFSKSLMKKIGKPR